jgi:alpha-1,6-mannosyltransferase
MKLVDVSAFYAPKGGGVRTYVDRKLKAGAALGHDVIIAPARGTMSRNAARVAGCAG